mmetsp:Transcript_136318/g.322935  ORF Transcript_136318/g.322935 Transcript_136318/m.322935 type:complete len:212 (-) Transcript_136318:76-711(-)
MVWRSSGGTGKGCATRSPCTVPDATGHQARSSASPACPASSGHSTAGGEARSECCGGHVRVQGLPGPRLGCPQRRWPRSMSRLPQEGQAAKYAMRGMSAAPLAGAAHGGRQRPAGSLRSLAAAPAGPPGADSGPPGCSLYAAAGRADLRCASRPAALHRLRRAQAGTGEAAGDDRGALAAAQVLALRAEMASGGTRALGATLRSHPAITLS